MSDLLEQFHICENRCSHLDPSTIKEYFPEGGFDKARKDFFKVVEADVKKFYDLPYPFVGRIVFDGNVFKNLVRIIPEFVISIIKTGMPAIITLGEFEIYEENDPVQLSHKNLLHASELVIESANLLNTIGLENRTPALKKRLNNKLRLLQINKSHYDLLGILQSIHNSTVLAANSMNLLEPGINHLYFHADQKKREILYSIVGPILNPLRTVATLGAGTDINAVKPLILAEIEKNGLGLISQPKPLAITDSIENDPHDYIFRLNGDFWQIKYGSEFSNIRDSKGLRYIYQLVAKTSRSIRADVLASADGRSSIAEGLVIPEDEYPVYHEDNSINDYSNRVSEKTPSASYKVWKGALSELEAKLDTYLIDSDDYSETEQRIRDLKKEISKTFNIRGEVRQQSDNGDKARQAVTQAIKRDIKKMSKALPTLSDHFSEHLNTGFECVYDPPPDQLPDWQL